MTNGITEFSFDQDYTKYHACCRKLILVGWKETKMTLDNVINFILLGYANILKSIGQFQSREPLLRNNWKSIKCNWSKEEKERKEREKKERKRNEETKNDWDTGLMQWLRRLLQRDGAINCEETRSHRQYDRTFNLFQLVARFVHYVLRLFGRIKARRWLTFQLTKVNAEPAALQSLYGQPGPRKQPALSLNAATLPFSPFLDAAPFRNYT